MAYSELVNFIKEQLAQGRDAMTIRSYLVQKNISPQVIDAAFDEVFGAAHKQAEHSSSSHHAQKFVVAGFIILVLAIIGIGAKFYVGLAENAGEPPVIETPVPVEEEFDVKEEIVEPTSESEKICDIDDSEEKYQCYVDKFEANEIQCHKIEDTDEREFCYVAQDLYVLSA